MARDDSLLYAGTTGMKMTSPKAKQLAGKKVDDQKRRQERRNSLAPATELINQYFAQEIHKITHEAYPDEEKMGDLEFRVERRARRLAVERLIDIQRRFALVTAQSIKHDAPLTNTEKEFKGE